MVTEAKKLSMTFFQLVGTTLINFQISNNTTPISTYLQPASTVRFLKYS